MSFLPSRPVFLRRETGGSYVLLGNFLGQLTDSGRHDEGNADPKSDLAKLASLGYSRLHYES